MKKFSKAHPDSTSVSIIRKLIYSSRHTVYSLLVTILLSSCYSSKSLNYVQADRMKLDLPLAPTTEYRVQPNDILNVRVQSRDPEQSTYFNIATADNRNTNLATLFLSGYSVNQEGTINLPIIGEVNVGNRTVEEIRSRVQSEIDKYLMNALVLVKLTSFKISVLGDVRNPGTNYIYNNQATIFEGLSAAGDLNVSAKRKNVKLIRQVGDKSVVVNLDLTKPSIIQSPYYFLQPNDVIYVETSKQGIVRENLGLISVVLAAVSTTVLILNFVTTN